MPSETRYLGFKLIDLVFEKIRVVVAIKRTVPERIRNKFLPT